MGFASHEAPMLTFSRTTSEAQAQKSHWTPSQSYNFPGLVVPMLTFSRDVDLHLKDRDNEDVFFALPTWDTLHASTYVAERAE
jgi:hypothetical protein